MMVDLQAMVAAWLVEPAMSIEGLVLRFGATRGQAAQAVAEACKHIAQDQLRADGRKPPGRLTPEVVISIHADLEAGLSVAKTARRNGVSVSSVHTARRHVVYGRVKLPWRSG